MIDQGSLVRGMQAAVAEARKWIGATSPNPPVGAAALDAAGKILMVTAHQRAGQPHAEAALIEHCRTQNILSNIETLCVTLEPCNHQGRTPPCTETIIQSGIKQIAIGTRDPNPSVTGGGMQRLQQEGLHVFSGIHENECQQLIHALAYSVTTGKPWITVKRAFDEKGSMIPPPGQKVFTSPSSLRLAHQLRKKADAIITGSGTILADTPLFTVRHVSDYNLKRRWLAVLDRRGRVPKSYIKAAAERGLDVVIYSDLQAALDDLARKDVRDILVEAGPTVSRTFLESHMENMSITIQKGEPDSIEVEFNRRLPLSFDTHYFQWDAFLPAEQ